MLLNGDKMHNFANIQQQDYCMKGFFTFIVALLCSVAARAQFEAPALTPPQVFKAAKQQQPLSLIDSPQVLKQVPDSMPTNHKNVARVSQTGPDLKTDLVIDDGTRVMGSITSWGSGPFTGIASLRPVNGTYPVSIAKDVPIGDIAAYDGKYYYGKTWRSGGGQIVRCIFYVYDATTWKLVKQVPMDTQWSSVSDVMAYNPRDGKIWAVGYDGLKRPFLCTVDKETGKHQYISQTMFTGNLTGMAFDKDGNCFGINRTGDLVSVDLNTGTTKKIATVAPKGISYTTPLAFDNHTGVLYMTNIDGITWANALTGIDVKTGKATVVSALPDKCTFAGLFVISPEAPAKAPNTVKNLSVDFNEKGSTTGTIHITAPNTTFDGTALSGNLSMKLYIDSVLVSTMQQSAGTTIDINHDFKTPGNHHVAVVYANAEGESPQGSILPFCGIDTPSAVDSLTVTLDDQNGKVALKWNAVQTGIHNGYVNLADMAYNIVLQPGNKTVAQKIKATNFDTTLPNDTLPQRYYYEVWPVSGNIEGEKVQSASMVFGKALDTPVKELLGSDSFVNLITTENRDGHGEGFYGSWGVMFCNFGYSDTGFKNDKWLYTPAIHLKKGTYYYRLQHEGSPFNLSFGKYRTPESQQENIIGRIDKDVTENDFITPDDNAMNAGGYANYITYKRMFDVKAEGNYYFGIQYDYDYPGGVIDVGEKLRQFEVKEGPSAGAPAECKADSAKTFPNGELKNHIYFTAPTTTVTGEKLAGISKVDFYLSTDSVDQEGRKVTYEKLVYTQTDIEPGKSYVADVPAQQGKNQYYFYAYNEKGKGGETEIAAWAGKDYPKGVQNPKFQVVENRDIVMTWDAPSTIGQNGGYVDPSNITYDAGIAQTPTGNLVSLDKSWQNLKNRKFTFYGDLTDQYKYYYGVTPKNDLGAGIGVMTPIVIGKPYTAPFKESFDFSSGSFKTKIWDLMVVSGEHSWKAMAVSPDNSFTPSDNDGGMLVYAHEKDELSGEILQTPILKITGSKKPTLSFNFHHDAKARDNRAGVSVFAVVNDVMEQQPIAQIGLNGEQTESGWKHYEIPLDKYQGKERVFFWFYATSEKSSSIVAIDNVEVFDNVPQDVALETMNVPGSIAPNENNEISVALQNRGRNKLDSYTLGLFANNQQVGTVEGKDLVPAMKATLTFNFTPAPTLYGQNITLTAKVLDKEDGNEDNNQLSQQVNVGSTMLPAPNTLTLDEQTTGQVKLSWTAPTEKSWTATTDNFENYQPYIISGIGPWTTYDGDKQLSMAPNRGDGYAADFANNWTAKSWQVWTVDGLTLKEGLADLMKLNGSKALISFDAQATYPDMTTAPAAKTDDWLISTRIAGGTKLKFTAREVSGEQHEKFEVLVSYGSQKPEDFGVLATEQLTDATAKEFEYTLPVDARYFAIRNVTEKGFALMIDDVEYTPGFTDLELLGYNIYRDGIKLNSEPVAELSFTDNSGEPAKKYGVTAVYDFDGESEMVTRDVTSGIEGIQNSQNVKVLTSSNGLILYNAKGNNAAVYDVAGQIVANVSISTNKQAINLPKGSYLLKIGNKTRKVLVR